MSLKRNLSATKQQLIKSAHDWHDQGLQIILQAHVGEGNEIKSGNIYLLNEKIIIEGARQSHHIFTNGKALDVNIIAARFDSYNFEIHKFFKDQKCLNDSEIIRLIRLSHKIPYNKAIIEFSYINDGNLYFWEIKKERATTPKQI